jgi:hypothetical protein
LGGPGGGPGGGFGVKKWPEMWFEGRDPYVNTTKKVFFVVWFERSEPKYVRGRFRTSSDRQEGLRGPPKVRASVSSVPCRRNTNDNKTEPSERSEKKIENRSLVCPPDQQKGPSGSPRPQICLARPEIPPEIGLKRPQNTPLRGGPPGPFFAPRGPKTARPGRGFRPHRTHAWSLP